MEYVELYNGNFQYIYIDTLAKREKQKSLILDLQKMDYIHLFKKIQKFYFMIYLTMIFLMNTKKN